MDFEDLEKAFISIGIGVILTFLTLQITSLPFSYTELGYSAYTITDPDTCIAEGFQWIGDEFTGFCRPSAELLALESNYIFIVSLITALIALVFIWLAYAVIKKPAIKAGVLIAAILLTIALAISAYTVDRMVILVVLLAAILFYFYKKLDTKTKKKK